MPRFVRPLLLATALVACAFAGVAAEQMPQDPANIIQPTDPAADPAATDAAASADEEKASCDGRRRAERERPRVRHPLGRCAGGRAGRGGLDLEGAGPFTVFAPNNEAFKKFFQDSDYTPKKLLADPELGAILRRHVIAGEVTAADALAMDLPAEVPTLDGESAIKIDKTVDGELLVAGNKVVSPDLKASTASCTASTESSSASRPRAKRTRARRTPRTNARRRARVVSTSDIRFVRAHDS